MIREIDRIAALLEDYVKWDRGIKSIYKGDPILIPVNSLPAIAISPIETRNTLLDSAHDQPIISVSISLITDARSFFNKSSDKPSGLYEIAKTMEERNSDNTLKDDTILGTIRKQFFTDADYNTNVIDERIDYGFTDKREYPTIEGVFTFTVNAKPHLRSS